MQQLHCMQPIALHDLLLLDTQRTQATFLRKVLSHIRSRCARGKTHRQWLCQKCDVHLQAHP